MSQNENNGSVARQAQGAIVVGDIHARALLVAGDFNVKPGLQLEPLGAVLPNHENRLDRVLAQFGGEMPSLLGESLLEESLEELRELGNPDQVRAALGGNHDERFLAMVESEGLGGPNDAAAFRANVADSVLAASLDKLLGGDVVDPDALKPQAAAFGSVVSGKVIYADPNGRYVFVKLENNQRAFLHVSELGAFRSEEAAIFAEIAAAVKERRSYTITGKVIEVSETSVKISQRALALDQAKEAALALNGKVLQNCSVVKVVKKKIDGGGEQVIGVFVELPNGAHGLLHVTELCDGDIAKYLTEGWKSPEARALRDARLASLALGIEAGDVYVTVKVIEVKESDKSGQYGRMLYSLSEAAVYFDALPAEKLIESGLLKKGNRDRVSEAFAAGLQAGQVAKDESPALAELREQTALNPYRQYTGIITGRTSEGLFVNVGEHGGFRAFLPFAAAGFKTGAPAAGKVKHLVVATIREDGKVTLGRQAPGPHRKATKVEAPAKKDKKNGKK